MSAAEERAAFWQETKHRMTRRLAGWDYRQRAIYMITVTLEDRRGEPLGKQSCAWAFLPRSLAHRPHAVWRGGAGGACRNAAHCAAG